MFINLNKKYKFKYLGMHILNLTFILKFCVTKVPGKLITIKVVGLDTHSMRHAILYFVPNYGSCTSGII